MKKSNDTQLIFTCSNSTIENTRNRCEICSKLTLNIIHAIFNDNDNNNHHQYHQENNGSNRNNDVDR